MAQDTDFLGFYLEPIESGGNSGGSIINNRIDSLLGEIAKLVQKLATGYTSTVVSGDTIINQLQTPVTLESGQTLNVKIVGDGLQMPAINLDYPVGMATEASLAELIEKMPGLGARIADGSMSVVLASDQPEIPVRVTNRSEFQKVKVINWEEANPIVFPELQFPDSQNVNVTNFPTGQTVSVSNFPDNQTVTVSNLPDIQKVIVTQPVSLLSGQTVNVGNLPLNQQVTVTSLPSVSVNNFPSVQAVNISGISSGLSIDVDNFPQNQHVTVTNFPGVQTVAVTSLPTGQTVSVSSLPPVSVSNFPSSQGVFVQNFPATQSVNVNNLPANQNVTVTSLPSVTVANFPGTQSVSLNSLPPVSVSNFPATQNVAVTSFPTGQTINVGNFPTGQTVNVGNFPTNQNVTVTSLPSVSINNFPTGQTVNVGNFPTSQNVIVTSLPSVSISNFPTTQNVNVTNFPTTQTVTFATGQTLNIQASSLPLPTGAATEATLSTLNGLIAQLNSKLPVTNATGVIEPSSAKTASGFGATQSNSYYRGAYFYVTITAVAGVLPTLVVRLQTQDPVSSNWVDMPNALTVSLSGIGTTLLVVKDTISNVANLMVNAPLPKVFRAAWTVTGVGGSFTFSIGAQYLI